MHDPLSSTSSPPATTELGRSAGATGHVWIGCRWLRVVVLVGSLVGCAGDQGANKPCEVHYKKETEQPGHDQLIWSTVANKESCATKAKEFVGKLSGWGWTCGSKP